MSFAALIANQVPLPSLPPYLTRYENGRTPLSTWTPVIFALATYLVVIFGVQEMMRPLKPLRLTAVSQLHNLVLSAGSLILLILIVEEMAPIVYTRGAFYSICNKGAWTPKLEFYYMINYYFKYLELLDTLLLVLKKKPLTFLHVFHHAATALVCYTSLNSKPSVIWVPITLNLTVHVFMYYYYSAAAGGRKIWWKKYLTFIQIAQFVIDLFVLYFAAYSHLSSTYFPRFPSPGTCTGSLDTGIFGCSILTSYLFLFVSFYKEKYEERQVNKGKPIGKANSTKIVSR